MIYSSTNVLGGGDIWSPNPDGTTNVQTLAENDTYVEFENVPANDDFGYVVWVFPETATDPTADAPVQVGDLVRSTPVGGLMTVRCNFASEVTSDQEFTTCKLRIVR
jgi:hypothetical protein